jgi:hypothetical protein
MAPGPQAVLSPFRAAFAEPISPPVAIAGFQHVLTCQSL